MSNLVIVAIPDENDPVWKVSSEKIPHLTLLFLGDVDNIANLDQIVLFVEHAANTALKRFHLSVDRRDELGADQADVLFFNKHGYDYKAIRDFRSALLQDNNIKTAYDSATQFDGVWQPHLTLGYPSDPAKPDEANYGFYGVGFSRIAVWVGEFDGPEFLLKDYWEELDEMEIPMDIAMSDLQHVGVKGMKWGQRKTPEQELAGRERKEARLDERRTEGANYLRVGSSKQDFKEARKDAKWLKRDVNPNNLFAMGKTDKKVFKDANKAMKPEVKALNKKPEYSSKEAKKEIKAQQGETHQKYEREHTQLFIKHMKTAAEKHKTVSPSGKWEDNLKISKDGAWTIGIKRTEGAKHADMETMDVVVRVRPIRDEDGYIVDYKLVEDAMTQTADLGVEMEIPMDIAMSELAHYGKKGMKWGVRNDGSAGSGETKKSRWDPEGHSLAGDVAKGYLLAPIPVVQLLSIPANVRLTRGAYRGGKAYGEHVSEKRAAKKDAKDDAKFEKVAKSQEGFVAIHNGASAKINREIDGINKKYPDESMKDPATRDKYDKEVMSFMQNAYRDSANSITNKRGDRHLDLEFKNDGLDFAIKVKEGAPKPSVEEAKHAAIDDDDVVTFTGKIKRAPTGHIIGFAFDDFEEASAEHTAELGAEFLEHFGVKGMKWGVRKAAAGAKATSTFVKDVQFETRTVNPSGGQYASKATTMVASASRTPFKKEDLPAVKARHGDYAKMTKRATKPFSKEAKAYRKDARETYIKRLETTANSMKNASGTREYTVRERGIDLPAQGGNLPKSKRYWEVSARDVEHAASNVDIRLELVMEDGYITDLKPVPVEDSLAQSAFDVGEDFVLEHFGVKGMRWGQRKSPPEAVATSSKSIIPHGTKRKTKVKVEGGENHPAHDDAIKVAEARTKLSKSGTAALSNQELREVANRLQLENQVAVLTSSRGKKFVTRNLEIEGERAVKKGVKRAAPHVVKKAGKTAATTAVTLALL